MSILWCSFILRSCNQFYYIHEHTELPVSFVLYTQSLITGVCVGEREVLLFCSVCVCVCVSVCVCVCVGGCG